MMAYGYILGLCAAAAAGAAVGILCTRSYFKKKYSDEAERQIAIEKSKRLQCKDKERDIEDEEAVPEETHPTYEKGESYIQNTMTLDQYHDYTKYYGDVDHPSEDTYLEDDIAGERMTEEHQTAPGPRIMAWEEIGQRPELEEFALIWYVDEGWMATEDGERVEDPRALVGDCLVEKTDECPSGFLASSRKTINIINERRGETYEVTKVRGRSYI